MSIVAKIEAELAGLVAQEQQLLANANFIKGARESLQRLLAHIADVATAEAHELNKKGE